MKQTKQYNINSTYDKQYKMNQIIPGYESVFIGEHDSVCIQIWRKEITEGNPPFMEIPHIVSIINHEEKSFYSIPLLFQSMGDVPTNLKLNTTAEGSCQYWELTVKRTDKKGWKFTHPLAACYASDTGYQTGIVMDPMVGCMFSVLTYTQHSTNPISTYKLTNNHLTCKHNTQSMSWSSHLQLQYKIKNLLSSIFHHRSRITHHQLYIPPNQLIIAYNRQLLIYQLICLYAPDYDRWVEEFNKLCKQDRLKYPVRYYSTIFQLYSSAMHQLSHLELPRIIQIIKYSMIQRIPIQTQLPTLTHQMVQVLEEDVVSNVLVFYMLLGMPGMGKTEIYSHLEAEVTFLGAKCYTVRPHPTYNTYNQQQLINYMKSPQLFDGSRHAFVCVDLPFSQPLLQQLLKSIQQHCPRTIHYQFYLLTPFLHKEHKFQQQHFLSTSSYLFSMEMMICAMLNVQGRKNHESFNGNGVDSVAKMLHYISSVYCGMDLSGIIGKVRGNVKVIEYESGEKVRWDDVGECDKEEIEDGLRALLELSYKRVYEKDALLCYFLDSIETIDYQFSVEGIATQVINNTFKPLPL